MSIVTIDLSKPCYISVFKNTRKEEGDNKPEYTVKIQQDRTDVLEGGLWLKEAASGLKYMNGSLKLPYAATQTPGQQAAAAHQQAKADAYQPQNAAPATPANLEDDLPF